MKRPGGHEFSGATARHRLCSSWDSIGSFPGCAHHYMTAHVHTVSVNTLVFLHRLLPDTAINNGELWKAYTEFNTLVCPIWLEMPSRGHFHFSLFHFIVNCFYFFFRFIPTYRYLLWSQNFLFFLKSSTVVWTEGEFSAPAAPQHY